MRNVWIAPVFLISAVLGISPDAVLWCPNVGPLGLWAGRSVKTETYKQGGWMHEKFRVLRWQERFFS